MLTRNNPMEADGTMGSYLDLANLALGIALVAAGILIALIVLAGRGDG